MSVVIKKLLFTPNDDEDDHFPLDEEVKSFTRALLRHKQQQHNSSLSKEDVRQVTAQVVRKYEFRFAQNPLILTHLIQDVVREFSATLQFSPDKTNVVHTPRTLERQTVTLQQPIQPPKKDKEESRNNNTAETLIVQESPRVRRLFDQKETRVTHTSTPTTTPATPSTSVLSVNSSISSSSPPTRSKPLVPPINLLNLAEQETMIRFTPRSDGTPSSDQKPSSLTNLVETSPPSDISLTPEKEDQHEETQNDIVEEYEQKIDQLNKKHQKNVSDYQEQLRKQREENEQLQKQIYGFEKQMKEMQHNMDLWKLEYHKSTSSKFKQMMSDVELQAKREVESSVRKQLEEEERRFGAELQKKAEEINRYKQIEEKLTERVLKDKQEALKQSKGSARVSKLRSRLQQLWQALDTETEDRIEFYQSLEKLYNYTPEVTEFYEQEIHRLSDQLPLMEQIMKREFIKQRISDFRLSSPRSLGEKQRTEIERELKRLEETLITDLPKYEKKYSSPFKYKGKQYLSKLISETKSPTYSSPLKLYTEE